MATSSLAGRCAPVLRLIPPSRCHSQETAQVLRELADLAERGEIIGLAYVAIRPHRKVIAATAGVATADPPLVTHWLTKLSHVLLES